MKKSLFLVLLLISWSSAIFAQTPPNIDQYSNPKKYEIAEIKVTGVKFLDPGALISLSGLRVGDQITIPGEATATAVRKLWRQGILGDVQIVIRRTEGDKVYLEIRLKERPKLTRFEFNGVRKGESQTLSDKIDLIKGKVVNDALLKNTRRTIEQHFNEKGFLNATAQIVQLQDTILSNSVRLQINVNKGKRVKIKEIAFKGNKVFKDKKLAKRMRGTKRKKALRIFTSSKFIEDKYIEDKHSLIAFYNAQGYRDARITADTVYSLNNKEIKIELDIEEGNQYYFRNITWNGNYVYDDKTLARILKIEKGDIYDVETLDKRLNFSQSELDITSLYMDDGYLFFRITPVEVAVEGDSVDIELQIYEGAQADISRIILVGNTKTNDRVVLREIRTRPGEKFSRSDLIRSQREIATLGYFDQEQIGINPLPNLQDGTVDIEYSVVERPSDQVELSGGWGGVFGFVGTLGLVFNNFSFKKLFKFGQWGGILPSGDGQRLALRAQANGRRFQTYSLTFTEPWLGGRKRNSFSVNLSHSVQRTIIGTEVLGSLQVTGITLSLGRFLTWPDDYFTLTNSISYLNYDLFNFGTSIFSSGSGTSRSIAFNTTLARNSIDNPTYPRRGSSLSLSLSLTPPYSLFDNRDYASLPEAERFRWIEYHKWMFDNSWFTNPFGKFVINTRAHFGYIGAYNQEVGVGPFERFTLGGDGLTGQNFLLGTEIIGLRGYENNSVTPINSAGGVVYNKFVMEARYPVSLNPAATIFLLGFLEGGNNWNSYEEYNPFSLKRSAGVGARIFMPAFGMIGLDWGYGFDEIEGRPGANEGRFHFTIGNQIR